MKTALYAAGWIGWPLLFQALAGRLLGLEIGRFRGALSGLAGAAIGALVSSAFPRGVQNFVVYVFFALLGTLASVAVLDILARPGTIGQLERSFATPSHPVRALRRRMGRGRRYAQVVRIALRHRLLSGLAASGRADARGERIGRDLTEALQEAGGVFVKLGQILSTRDDLLPPSVTGPLSALQDRVAPVPGDAIEALMEEELGRPISQVFARFDRMPLAAASIGQVHRARLPDGRDVAVKIQRPDIEDRVERDLDVILRLARRLEATTAWGRRVGVADMAHGFAANLREELDYQVEARNTRTVQRLLRQHDRLRVPAVYEHLCTRRVLVLEWLDGIALRDAGPHLADLGVDRTALARELLAGFLNQVLDAGVFNADPHPGNVLVLGDGSLAQIDFGSVGRLHALQQFALARLLIAVDRADPELFRGALLELAATSEPIDRDALDRALAQFLALRLGPGTRPGAELFTDLLALLATFGLAFDPQLTGAFRALLTLEGTLRTLDPGFELVEEVKHLARGVGRRAFGPGVLRQAVVGDVLKLAPILRSLPRRFDRITAAMERDEWGLNVRLLANERDVRLVTRLVDRGIVAFMSASIGIVSALLLGVAGSVNLSKGVTPPQVFGYIGLGVATILGLRVLVAITRDRVM